MTHRMLTDSGWVSFLDSEVLAPNFKDTLCEVVKVVKPFVHW